MHRLLTAEVAAKAFDGRSRRFPPLLTEKQAIELLQIDSPTFERWQKQGKLACCSCHRGKLVRFWRDWLVEWFFNNGKITATPMAQKRNTIKTAVAMHVKYLESEGRSRKTVYKYRATFRHVQELAKGRGIRFLDELDVAFLDAYRQLRASEGKSPKTLWNETTTIKQLLNFAVSRGQIDANRLKAAKYDKPKSKLQPFRSIEQVQQILKSTETTSYHDVYLMLSETGMRVGEVQFLTWDDVDLANRVLYVREKQVGVSKRDVWKPKTGEHRVVPLSDDIIQMLNSRPRRYRWVFPRPRPHLNGKTGTPFNDRNVLTQLKRVLKSLGLKGHVHTFRHSFISHALVSGVPEAVVREWVGHVDPQTIHQYTHISDARSHAEIDRIFACRKDVLLPSASH